MGELAYIDYQFYAEHGGRAEEAAFPGLEYKARRRMDYYTQNRILKAKYGRWPYGEFRYDDFITSVKLAEVEIINLLYDDTRGEAVKSFTNAGISVAFADGKRTDDAIYEVIREYLPRELLYRGVAGCG